MENKALAGLYFTGTPEPESQVPQVLAWLRAAAASILLC